MKDEVMAYWDPSPNAPERQAELAALWVRSWKARGWKPRIYLPGKEKPFRGKHPAVSEFGMINFSFKPSDPVGTLCFFDTPGWESADIVDFGRDASPEFVLQCGVKI